MRRDYTRAVLFELQPRIQNALVRLEPLRADDFDALFAVASDPLIWEQHPSRDRYQRDVFTEFFTGALACNGASCVLDANMGELIGCSRYYELDASAGVVAIGYTFLARHTWGRGHNSALKQLMLDHAFASLDRVLFHVGESNLRSRKAVEKLGAVFLGQDARPDPAKRRVTYAIDKADWARRH